MDNVCYFDYIYNPISLYRKTIFKEIAGKIKGGHVLDLGSGSTGYYWALGYMHKVLSISFYDISSVFVNDIEQAVNTISAEKIETSFKDTISFLRNEDIIPATYNTTDLATDLVDKTRETKVFDFLHDISNQTFDCVISIESIECVDSQEQLQDALDNVYSLLNKNGQFLGVVLPYKDQTAYVNDLIQQRLEGQLNPSLDMIKRNLLQAGFTINSIHMRDTGMRKYPDAIFFNCYK